MVGTPTLDDNLVHTASFVNTSFTTKMLFNTVAGLASLAFVTVDAAPAPTARADFGSLKDCTDLSISGAWMIGTCPADDGHKVKSTIWLGTKVTNNGGSLGVSYMTKFIVFTPES
jgi:hypothetical protein